MTKIRILGDKLVDYATYCDMVNYTNPAVAAQTLIVADIAGLEDLERAQLATIKKALGDVNNITLADADAVNAFVDAQDEYNDSYAPGGAYAGEAGNPAKYAEADAYATKIWNLQVDAAKALIKALPSENATSAQLKEARDAVEALDFEGTCELKNTGLLTKLNRLEQNAATAAIKSVESLKITASSTAIKGSITVKWKVVGDITAVEGWEIWKSTKKNSGYSKSFTQVASKQTYKNTKELKKGTRYYYKVRAIAYTADGTKVKSDWSNKAYRIAK